MLLNSQEKSKFARLLRNCMKKSIIITFVTGIMLASCSQLTRLQKSTDYVYKYEAAKSYFGEGKYSTAAELLEELVPILKGTTNGEESLYLLAMAYMNQKDYVTASHYFTQYYNTYTHGKFNELARYNSGKALVLDTPEPRLDQSSTVAAIAELSTYIEYFPNSKRAKEAQQLMYEMQDKLVEKEYLSAKLYYDLGTYMGNASYTSDMKVNGNNFLACITTVENILKDYPGSSKREELGILLLRAKYKLAQESVDEKKSERMQEAVDEYYTFKNDFPESKYMKEVENIYKDASKYVKTIED